MVKYFKNLEIFLPCSVCIKVTYGDVSYDNVPETFPTSKEQRNTVAIDEKKEKCV